MSIIFFDTETTGIEEKDEVIQLAYIVSENGNKIPANKYYKPNTNISFGAMAVHHITPEKLKDNGAITSLTIEDELMQTLLTYNTPDNILVAHNIKFDLDMLERHGFKSNMRHIDTLRCSKHLLKAEGYSLGSLFYELGLYKKIKSLAESVGVDISKTISHDAMYDVIMLILLTKALLSLDNINIDTLVELTKKPVLIDVFTFGKYKGQKIEDIATQDKGYLNWMLDKMENLDDDMRYTLSVRLNRITHEIQ